MNQDRKNQKTVYRLVPCSVYDVEMTENWLNDMTKEGYLLEEDDFHFGFIAKFQRNEEAKKFLYRLEAGTNHGPKPDALELYENYGWKYIGDRVYFHIFRGEKGKSRELNTDAKVQAMSLHVLVRALLFELIVYGIAMLIPVKQFFLNGVFLTVDRIPIWSFVIYMVFYLWFLMIPICDFAILFRQWNRLRKGVCPDRKKSWKKSAAAYRSRILGSGFMILLLVISFIEIPHDLQEEFGGILIEEIMK